MIIERASIKDLKAANRTRVKCSEKKLFKIQTFPLCHTTGFVGFCFNFFQPRIDTFKSDQQ